MYLFSYKNFDTYQEIVDNKHKHFFLFKGFASLLTQKIDLLPLENGDIQMAVQEWHFLFSRLVATVLLNIALQQC